MTTLKPCTRCNGSGTEPEQPDMANAAGSDHPDPYVRGWHDCAESIAILCEIKARDLMASRKGLRDRLVYPSLAQVYRHAAELARATTKPGKGARRG